MNGALRLLAQQHKALALGQVVPDAFACCECGICSFNCPAGIDVRAHARVGAAVVDPHCLSCGECVARCPRLALHLELSSAFQPPD